MIGRLRGIILEKRPPLLLLDVNGVGYEVHVSMNTFYLLPEIGKEVILYTHLIVREDAHILYGFCTMEERLVFRELIKISGIGPKTALAVLSSMTPDRFMISIQSRDHECLVCIPGIGKKTAERLLVEMQDRLKKWPISEKITKSGTASLGEEKNALSAKQEAFQALVTLGYKPYEAERVLASVDETLPTAEIIRLALRSLSA